MKKTLSVILSLVLVLLSMTAGFSSYADEFPRSIDADGKYHRISDGVETVFNTSYDEFIDELVEAIENRDSSFKGGNAGNEAYLFATEDERYQYTDSDQNNGKLLVSDIKVSVENRMKKNSLDTLDYFYNQVRMFYVNYSCLTTAPDAPFEQDGVTHKFYTYRIYVKFEYKNETTKAQESYITEKINQISNDYLSSCSSDYEKVKTIYDFVVRNSEYDNDVRDGKFIPSSQRYKDSHSAYGALCGSLENDAELNLDTKDSITGQKIVKKSDQGLAVCEGLSQLFYLLCINNGIPCHIVSGDNCTTSGKASDPHQWNMVYLDDGNGARWFLIDITYAERYSYKLVDLNNYDYFLCGTENIHFGYMNHQQPFVMSESDKSNTKPYNSAYPQRYDWYPMMSPTDYEIKPVNFESVVLEDNDVIIRRDTVYNEGETAKSAFIKTNLDKTQKVEYDEDENDKLVIKGDVQGFTYNGKESTYTMQVPYLVDREFSVSGDTTGIVNVGSYTIMLNGSDNTKFSTTFEIVALDMSNASPENYGSDNYIVKVNEQDFKGGTITPSVTVQDRYGNPLVEGRDYDLHVHNSIRVGNEILPDVPINNVGLFYLYVDFKGNYKSSYLEEVTVDKIKLENLRNSNTYIFSYVPKYFRENKMGVFDATGYFNAAGKELAVGNERIESDPSQGIKILLGKDYSITAEGGLEYGNEGSINLSGLNSSSIIQTGYPLSLHYRIGYKYDISYLSGEKLGSAGSFTGQYVEPTSFPALEKMLTPNVDYQIVGYNNNVKAGWAQVTIAGINGCEGTATLDYYIDPVSLSQTTLTYETTPTGVAYKLVYNGMRLVKGTDFTETTIATDTGYTIVLNGAGNYGGSTSINVKVSQSPNNNTGTTQGTTVSGGTKTNSTNGNSQNTQSASQVNVGKPKTPTLSKPTAKKKSCAIKWKFVPNAVGYQVQIAKDSKFKKNKKTFTFNANTTSVTVNKLKSKQKYYVRIRSYNNYKGKKTYSAWSKAKTVKIK